MTGPRWQVACPEYRTPPVKDRATAERQMATIEKLGACRQVHEVVEVQS